MGVENNEAILATTFSSERVEDVRKWVGSLSEEDQSLFAFIPALTNGKTTIILAPCGSKKGWGLDEYVEDLRNEFINLLESFDYEDGSNPFEWVEVGYGSYGQTVLRGNNENCYNNRYYAV